MVLTDFVNLPVQFELFASAAVQCLKHEICCVHGLLLQQLTRYYSALFY